MPGLGKLRVFIRRDRGRALLHCYDHHTAIMTEKGVAREALKKMGGQSVSVGFFKKNHFISIHQSFEGRLYS